VRIQLHGTGAGDPNGDRAASAATVRFSDGTHLLVDAGEACSRALVRDGIDCNTIRAVVISHMHPDHWTGLPGLATAWFCGRRSEPVDVYVPPGCVDFVLSTLLYSYWFPEIMPCDVRVAELKDLDLPDGMQLTTFPTTHLDRSAKAARNNGIPSSCVGYVLESRAGRIVFSQDIGSIDDLRPVVSGARLLICECAHVLPIDVVNLAEEERVPEVVFTHVPPKPPSFDGMPSSPTWTVAQDGLTLELA
jgi:ribonuclease BN (tRNA processing enzyme)